MPLSSVLPIAAIYAAAILGFALLHFVVLTVWPRTVAGRGRTRALRDSISGAVVFAALLVFYAGVASALRVDPATGSYRSGSALEDYAALARAALVVVYAAGLALAAVIGAAFARGQRAGSAVANVSSVGAFMLLVAPLSELLSECYANVTLVLRPSC